MDSHSQSPLSQSSCVRLWVCVYVCVCVFLRMRLCVWLRFWEVVLLETCRATRWNMQSTGQSSSDVANCLAWLYDIRIQTTTRTHTHTHTHSHIQAQIHAHPLTTLTHLDMISFEIRDTSLHTKNSPPHTYTKSYLMTPPTTEKKLDFRSFCT